MLTKINRSDISGYRDCDKSPLRLFCERTAKEFLAESEHGDVAEVTGAPVDMDGKGVQRLASGLRDALFYMDREKDVRREVRVMTRGGRRVFLERRREYEPAPHAKTEGA